MLAEIGSTGYKFVLLIHILAALVAFAPAFVHPLLGEQTKQLDPSTRGRVIGFLASNSQRVYSPALIVVGLAGFALQGMSDSVWKFSQTWIWLSAILWIAMNGVVHAMLIPAEKAVAAGDEAAAKRVQTGGMITTILMVVVLYLMVFKPGF